MFSKHEFGFSNSKTSRNLLIFQFGKFQKFTKIDNFKNRQISVIDKFIK